jgi:hypothetical protein
LPAGDIPALVKQDRGDVAPLAHRPLDQVRILPEVNEQHLEAAALEFGIDPVDGRQLLPTVWSPGRPEKQHDNLALEVLQTNRFPFKIRKGARKAFS